MEAVEEQSETKEVVIPDEFTETPDGYLSVFMTVRPESINFIAQNGGFRTRDNLIRYANPELEEALNEVGKGLGINIDRRECIFAHPEAPTEEDGWYSSEDNPFIIEALVDPAGVLVTDGNLYSSLFSEFYSPNSKFTEMAEGYWQDAIPLKQYQDMKNKPHWSFPEALISKDINLKHVRLVHSPGELSPNRYPIKNWKRTHSVNQHSLVK